MNTLSISVIVLVWIASLGHSGWIWAVGRELESSGQEGASKCGFWFAVCFTFLGVVVAAADGGEAMLGFIPIILVGLATATSTAWRAVWPGIIIMLGSIATVAGTILAGALMQLLFRGGGTWPAVLGYVVAPCVIWNLITGPWLMAWARGVKAKRGGCPVCGYDLSGLREGAVCPECGTSQPKNELAKAVISSSTGPVAAAEPHDHGSETDGNTE